MEVHSFNLSTWLRQMRLSLAWSAYTISSKTSRTTKERPCLKKQNNKKDLLLLFVCACEHRISWKPEALEALELES